MRILVAEDDKVVSMLVCAILRDEGHQALAAFDQMQVLMFAARAPAPDVIILDLNMPGGTGGETLRRLKTSPKTSSISVIVLSGTPDPDAPATVQKLGGDAVLSKPVDRKKLLAELALMIVPDLDLDAGTRKTTVVRSARGAARFAYE
jgi:CheY-like chemotaxis protein